jgi:hypothetical protein
MSETPDDKDALMGPRVISFADYTPGEVPDRLPKVFWVYWDIWGEFMDATEDPAVGEKWLASKAGYVARYERKATNQPDWQP